ncbi:MAG: hypothetical protein NT007_14210 [Candidatus Kapabacteria bacterium]|nr:hypothetical protein [Candidatus Kapabacteria bacterium]
MQEYIPATESLNFEKVWALIQATNQTIKELAQQSKDTDRKFQDTDRKFQDTDRKFQESRISIDKEIRELINQTKKTELIVDKLSKKMKESESRWAKFVESLVEGELIKLLNAKGIAVEQTTMRAKKYFNNREFEIDIIAINGNEMLAVEVKTTLGVEDVNEFIEEMKEFREVFPQYREKKVYGAVAYISVDSSANKLAERQGFYVIRATGESAKIINKENFKPKEW